MISNRTRIRFAMAALLGFGFMLAGCRSAMTPRDPRLQIPDWSIYRNASIGFYFQYPPILEMEENDRDLDGTEVSILYPGMRSEVFKVEVRGATAEAEVMAKKIPGTEKSFKVGREAGTRYQSAGSGRDGKPEERTLVKKDGWIFVFSGSGKTFQEILAGFRFGTPPPVPEE